MLTLWYEIVIRQDTGQGTRVVLCRIAACAVLREGIFGKDTIQFMFREE